MSTTPSTTTEPTAILAGTAIIVSAAFVPSVQSPDEQPEGVTLSPEELAVKLSHNPQIPNVTVCEPESAEPFSDLNQQLNDFAAQLPTVAASEPAPAGEQNEQRCYDAKCSVMRYYGASTIAEYLQGRYLTILQAERAKPGSGKFVADLAELRKAGALLLSNATAYRRIAQYKKVRDGLADLLPDRLSQREKDAWGLEELTVEAFEEAIERETADEQAKAYQDLIQKVAAQQRDLQREQNGSTTLNVQLFGLADEDKKHFRAAFNALVEANMGDKVAASKYLVNMVCFVAQRGNAVIA